MVAHVQQRHLQSLLWARKFYTSIWFKIEGARYTPINMVRAIEEDLKR